jgi:hypothetical protein
VILIVATVKKSVFTNPKKEFCKSCIGFEFYVKNNVINHLVARKMVPFERNALKELHLAPVQMVKNEIKIWHGFLSTECI